jgi:hypothetical protein
MYNLKLVTTLWLLNLYNLEYIIFLTIYVTFFFLNTEQLSNSPDTWRQQQQKQMCG